MNKLRNIILLSLVGLLLFSCAEEELRVKYPASVPVFKSVAVSKDVGVFMYGDSVTVSAEIADNVAPLSTLEVKIVVNDVQIAKASIRTKGNSASYTGKYAVPFGPFMPDNAEVEVHLSSINVEGYHADTLLTDIIVKRPEIPTMWLITSPVDKSSAIELKLTDASNHIYSIEGLTYENKIQFLLPTKVTRFKKIDWTAPVFGKNSEGELDYITKEEYDKKVEENNLDDILLSLSDPTLIGFGKIELDLFHFTVSGFGEKLKPVTEFDVTSFPIKNIESTNHLNEKTKEDWHVKEFYFGKDTEVVIHGITTIAKGVSPDFFEVVEGNTVKFLGETGVYTVYYLPSADYLFVEQPTAVYPAALWLDGIGFGRPQGGVKTSSWNWNSPLEYRFCRTVSPGVYQTTLYVNHEDGSTWEEAWRAAFSAKFFHQRGWGGEMDAREYAISTPLLEAPTDHDAGNFYGTDALQAAPGVYRFTINTTTKTISFEKVN